MIELLAIRQGEQAEGGGHIGIAFHPFVSAAIVAPLGSGGFDRIAELSINLPTFILELSQAQSRHWEYNTVRAFLLSPPLITGIIDYAPPA